MKAQAELDFPPLPPPSTKALADQGRRAWDEDFVPAFKGIVSRLSLKVVADMLGVRDSYLDDALAGRDRKGIKGEWIVVLLYTAPPAVRHEIVSVINEIAGYKAPELRRKISVEDELAIRKRETKRLAPGIEALIEDAIKEAG